MVILMRVTDVLAVETPNHPGGLNAILKPLREAEHQRYLSLYLPGNRGEDGPHRRRG